MAKNKNNNAKNNNAKNTASYSNEYDNMQNNVTDCGENVTSTTKRNKKSKNGEFNNCK